MKATRLSVSLAGVSAMIVMAGVARFSYTSMIPYMQQQTGMGEALAGWLAGWNYLGYLIGVAVSIFIHNIQTKDACYRAGLILAIISTIMMAVTDSPTVWIISRLLAGIAAAAGFIISTGLVLHWLLENDKKPELGLHFAGTGLGIIVAGVVVEGSSGLLDWQGQWWALALVGAAFSFYAMYALPRPQHVVIDRQQQKTDLESSKVWRRFFQVMYFCAGLGYVITATFIVVITELQPSLQGKGALMWLLVGICAAPAPMIWDRLSRRIGVSTSLKWAFVLQIIGIMLPVISASLLAAIINAVLFGFTFIGIVSLSMSLIGRRYPSQSSQMMALGTFGFSIGQIVGPIVAGEIAEATGTFDSSLIIVSGFMCLGLFCLFMMDRWHVEETNLAESTTGG